MGWTPGTITIKKGGVDEVAVYADLVFPYSTSDGTHACWWQPAYPSGAAAVWGAADGRFYTDANGVLWDWSDGTQKPIIVPRGFGALGYRAGDAWASAPTSERLLTKLEVWYLQESAEVSEGAATTLDVAAVSITISGPVGARYGVYWEDSIGRAAPGDPPSYGTIPAGGEATLSGLPPGRYTVGLWHATDYDKGWPRQTVEAFGSGGSYGVSFGSATTVPTNKVQGIIYSIGTTGASGAVIYYWAEIDAGPPAVIELLTLATCAGDGSFGPVDQPIYPGVTEFIVYHPTWGTFMVDATLAAALWFDGALAGRFGAIRSGLTELGDAEGIVPWPGHLNLPMKTAWGYAKDAATGEEFPFGTGTVEGSSITQPLPRGKWTPPATEPTWAVCAYDIYSADDVLLLSGYELNPNQAPLWGAGSGRNRDTDGKLISVSVGGKIEGNLVEASRGELVTVDNLREAARMGLERGRFTQPLEVRLGRIADDSDAAPPTTFTAWECPYCGGPAWMGPDVSPYLRGHCVPCLDNGYTVDCRTYFLSPTLAAVPDWLATIVKDTTVGDRRKTLVRGWPRPEEYEETGDYLVDPWVDGLPRWVAEHIVLGIWNGAAFVDGESIADVETRLGRTVGPVHLKAITTSYCGEQATVLVTATRSNGQGSEVLTGVIPAGSPAGTIVFLRWESHDRPPPRGHWYTDVTDIGAEAPPTLPPLAIVNDGPAWHGDGVEVTHQAYSPYACDALFAGGRPHLKVDPAGWVWMVAERRGQIVVWIIDHPDLRPYRGPWAVTDDSGWSNPSIAPRSCGSPMVMATRADGVSVLFTTVDGGATWEALA